MSARHRQRTGVAAHAAVGFVLALASACGNEPPTILGLAVIGDTALDSGPYEVRVVAYDDDGVQSGRIAWRAETIDGSGAPTRDGGGALTLLDDAVRTEGQRLIASIPGQRVGSRVTWSAYVCDAREACTRSDSSTFVVGARPSEPVIDVLSPAEGPESGGTVVSVRGRDFRPGAVVEFGGEPSAHTEWLDPETLRATTAPHLPGVVDVEVRNPDDARARSPQRFEFLPAPLLVTIEPARGPAAGGTSVVLRGERFFDGVRVLFDGAPCRALARVSEDEIRCVTPPGAPGPADVEVRHDTRGFSRLVDGFVYVEAPRIDGVDPPSGPDTGGTSVVVIGSGFVDGAQVYIDGAPCTDAVVVSENEIVCTTPAGEAGVGDVLVINPDGQQDLLPGGFDYEGPPVVVAVDPPEGPLAGGTDVRVLGAGFRADDVVRFGGVEADIVEAVSDAEVVVRVPPGPFDVEAPPQSGLAAVDVEVERQDPIDTRAGVLDDGFSYFWPPEVERVTPPSGPTAGGTPVVIDGRFFRAVVDARLFVRFDGAECAAVQRLSSTSLACTTPPGEAGFADVEVQNHPQSAGLGPMLFEYIPPPHIDAIEPREGPTFGGETVTVRGSGFQDGAQIFIDGAPCLDVVVVSSSELFCTTPPGEEGLADVRVLNPDAQEDTAPALYQYLGVAVSPDHGTIVGFTRVRVRSAGMQPGAVITFGGVAADCAFVSAREFVCQTPAHAAGAVTVAFANPDNTGEDSEQAFDYRVLVDRTAGRVDNLGNNANHVEALDADQDGDLDLVVANGQVGVPQPAFLFANDGSADFTRDELFQATANKVDVGDFDLDDRLDLVFATTSGEGAQLFRNSDDGFVLVDQAIAARGAFDAMLADLTGDERDDLFVLTIGCDPFLDQEQQPMCDSYADGLDVLWESRVNGFVDRSDLVPHSANWTHDHKMVAADLEPDGDQDIVIVVNNDPYDSAQNRVLRNRVDEGAGFVVERPADLLDLTGDLYDVAAGDIDGDGDEDIVTTICFQPFGPGEIVLANDGGSLVRAFDALPFETDDCDVGTALVDIDDDGDLDVLFGGTRFGGFNIKLYVNRGDGTFVDGAAALPEVGGAQLQANHFVGGDFDRDGDRDVAIAAGAPYGQAAPGELLLLLLE